MPPLLLLGRFQITSLGEFVHGTIRRAERTHAMSLSTMTGPDRIFGTRLLLDAKVGFENFAHSTGYRPPFTSIDSNGSWPSVIPKTLPTSVVTQDMMECGRQLGQLSPDVEDLWTSAWEEIKAGA